MTDETDWRLQGQEDYLYGLTLVRRRYLRPSTNPDWDHDHCEFCGGKFMVEEVPDVLHEGYATPGESYWICPPCFRDFVERFAWLVVDPEPNDA